MTIQAQLHDGTVLEFPDDTDEKVISSVVRKHMSSVKQDEPDNLSAKQIGKNALGGLASAADFALMMGSLPISGVAGLVGGAQDALTGKGDFLSGATRRIGEVQDMFNLGSKMGIQDNPGYQAGTHALGMPGEVGMQAARGLGAVTRLPFEGVEGAAQHITNPELTPFSSAVEDTLGTFMGYGMAGKAAEGMMYRQPNLRPTDVPPAVRDIRNEQQRPPPSPDKGPLDPKQELALVPELDTETVVGRPSFMRNNRTGENLPFPREEVVPPLEVDPMAMGDYRGNNMDVDTSRMSNRGLSNFMEGAELPPDATREGGPLVERGQSLEERNQQSDMQRTQEEQNRAAADYEARRAEFGEDPPLRTPQELALDYDPFSLKDLDKVPEDWQVRDEIERGRETFPTMDIDLLPEAVAKDSVIKGNLTKYNKLLEEHNKLMDQAREVAVQGERIKFQEVGRTKKSKDEVAQIQAQIAEVQKKMDVVTNQLYNRMSNKHGVKEPGMMLYRGRTPEKSGTPDMQRSPDANITGAGAVKKTFVPKGQRGSIDPSVFTEGIGKLLEGAKASGKIAMAGLKANQPKRDEFSRPDLIRSLTGADSRDPVTFAKDVLKDKDSLVDIDDNISIKGVIRQDLTPAAVGRLNYKNNPIVSYVSHVMDKVDGATKRAKERALWGYKASTNWRGLPSLAKTDAGARTISSTFKNKKRQEVFRSTTMKYADGKILRESGLESPTDSMLAADGLNGREIQAYRAREKVLDKVLQDLREAGAQVEKTPGFFPGIWMGDYRVFVKDASGETVQVVPFNHPFQVKRFIARMEKELPDHTFDPKEAADNKYALNDMSAFQIASKIFPADTPIGKLLDQVRTDITKHRGFGKHFKQKKGVEGFLGSEEGSFSNMEKALDIYLEQAYNFISDLQKRKLVEGTMEAFKNEGYSVAENLPNTNRYVYDVLANSIGAMENGFKLLDSVLEGAGELSGRVLQVGGKSSVKHVVRGLNGAASLYNLFTGKQFMLNAMQPIYMMPKAMQLASHLDTPGITRSMMEAYMEVVVPGKLTKDSRAALEYARDSGMIDARTLELIGSNTGKAQSLIMKGTGHMASFWEQEAVRTPAFLFFNKLLSREDLSPRQRYESAAQLTADYMVNYSKTQTPGFYSRMGIAGDAVRPYQQFTHNYHGQLLEYTKELGQNKKLRPLATFLAAQWALGGIRGLLPIFGGAVAAIAYLNNIITEDGDGTPMPTPEEWLMASGASDLAVFGLASKVTGVNIATSGAAPNIVPTPGMPGLAFAAKMGKDVGGLALNMMRGTDTEADRMQAAMTATPSVAKGLTEQMFARPDGTIPNPSRDMQSDLGRARTPFENFVKLGLGAEPASEGIAKGRLRAEESYRKSLTSKQNQYLDKIVDDLIVGRGKNSEMINKFVKSGGDPDRIEGAITSTLKKRLMSRVESELMSGSDYTIAQRRKLMQKYQIQVNGLTDDQMIEVLQNQ